MVNSLPKLRINPKSGPPSGFTSAKNLTLMQVSVEQTQQEKQDETPLTLSPALATQFVEALQFCKTIVDFDNPQTINMRSKKADYLTKIFNTVNNVHVFRSLDESLRVELFDMIKVNILREIPPIPLTIIYADSRIPINTNSWLHLSTVHRILYSFVSNSEISALQNLLTKDFLTRYITLLESPDPKEIQAVESFILLVFDTVSGYRQIIFQIILRQLLKYRDNYMLYPCVAPCLRFLHHFLKAQTLPLKSPFFTLYKTIIFPLISSQMSSEFFGPFNQLAEFFESQDGTISTWTLYELVKHWPKTDTNKETAFLSHFSYLAPHLPPKDIESCGLIIFNILKESLDSLNFKTNISALNVITNKNFLIVFSSFSTKLVPIILKGVDRCSTHWNVVVSKAALDAARVLMSVNHDVGSRLEIGRIESERNRAIQSKRRNWEVLVEEVTKNDKNNFDKEEILQRIDVLFK